MSLDGKTVFLTGATGGIGVPLVDELLTRGVKLRCYDRATQGDLLENIDTVSKSLNEQTPDILINLAGQNDFSHAEDQNYDALIALNLLVPMRLAQAVLPNMRRRNAGQIVNIGSMVGLIPLPHTTGYAAAKAGLKGFSDALRREVGGTGIIITHISPRAVKTRMNDGVAGIFNRRAGITEDAPSTIAKRICLALERRETDVRIGRPERLFAILNAIFPAVVDWGLRKNRKLGEEILAAQSRKAARLAEMPSQSSPHSIRSEHA